MTRIAPVTAETASPKAQTLLDGVQKSLGIVPNMMATIAHSPATLQAYLGFGQALGGGTLGGKLREQVALAVAGENSCEYCASAHTAIGGNLGLDADELSRNLQGASQDPKTEAALTFARTVVDKRGWVSDADVQAVRDAGYTEGEIVELIGTVVINIFTNYFNHIAQTDVDFPKVAVGAPAA